MYSCCSRYPNVAYLSCINFGCVFLQTKKRKRGRKNAEACTGRSCQISLERGK